MIVDSKLNHFSENGESDRQNATANNLSEFRYSINIHFRSRILSPSVVSSRYPSRFSSPPLNSVHHSSIFLHLSAYFSCAFLPLNNPHNNALTCFSHRTRSKQFHLRLFQSSNENSHPRIRSITLLSPLDCFLERFE